MNTELRTLNPEIILSDNYQKLSDSAKSLYIILLMKMDGCGFVDDVHRVACDYRYDSRQILELVNRGFIILFKNNSILITHVYHHTQREISSEQILIDSNRTELYRQTGLDSNYVFYDKTHKVVSRTSKQFVPPTLDEVKAYCKERNSTVDPVRFFTYFNTPNEDGQTWVDSKGMKVRNWKGKLVTWERNNKISGGKNERSNPEPSKQSSKWNIHYDT